MSTPSISSLTSYMPPSSPTFSLMIPHSDARILREAELHQEGDSISDTSSSTSTLVHSSTLGIRENFAHRYSHKVVSIALGMACAMGCTFFIMRSTLPDEKELSDVFALMLKGMGMIELGLLIIFFALEKLARARARDIT